MKIIIPSRGRPDNVRTLECLVHDDVTLVVPKDEVTTYANRVGMRHPEVQIVSVDCANIMEKRQFVLDRWARGHKIVMMDDDLRFRRRGPDGKFHAAVATDIGLMLRRIDEMLNVYCHGGISDEFMCQHNPPGHVTRRRYNQVLAYNFTRIEAPRYRLTINEEHDLHLQLLRNKHVGFVLTDFTKGSKFNASGGCSTWRTPELELSQFQEFEKMWPGIVSLRPNKNSLCGWSTSVRWRKA